MKKQSNSISRGFVLGLGFILYSCCMETEANFQWDIINNTSDTVTIEIGNPHFGIPDSIVILPSGQFSHTEMYMDGKNKIYKCGKSFSDSREVSISISGGKTLMKPLHVWENWEQSSDFSTCGGEHQCRFVIEQQDLQ